MQLMLNTPVLLGLMYKQLLYHRDMNSMTPYSMSLVQKMCKKNYPKLKNHRHFIIYYDLWSCTDSKRHLLSSDLKESLCMGQATELA